MYRADEARYDKMSYKRCGNSGILLPRVSLGMWQNFGAEKPLSEQKEIIFKAFDLGITHFDLANNYGAPNIGMAEENFGKIFLEDLKPYREQILVSTKAGYDFWPGPYGNWGSRKYLMSSLDASLKAHESGLCRYLLSSPPGSGDTSGGDDGCPFRYGSPG